jgi:hypothetical protein
LARAISPNGRRDWPTPFARKRRSDGFSRSWSDQGCGR